MEARIKVKTDDYLLIVWESEKGFGQLTMQWDQESGRFILDPEMMSIDIVIEIFKRVKL